ncbi:hypothetical protein BHAMNSH16_00375 [Brachyspira hampsonii]|uniref:Uncharacterized protein n=1 Tax=Brachyspira hampsonii TaxID=1287055 RepID=A0AAC9XJG7_9SPIR|nr:hypothetical protein [Brachyspira hampsonii]ASJ20188.1 hypothetical protein BHAMNSH16_00375 [Brachyspira hampsonii]OEJ17016.1 hypothetical protein A9496_11960 [Brachyspira hampsonii]
MIEKDGILLLDGQTKYNIDHNPNKTREIINGFSMYNFGDDILKGLKLKLDAKEPMDLFQYRNDKAVYLVNSKIYNNVYYTIESFNTNYKKDFRNLIIRIARKMGAKLITVVFSDEEDYNSSNKYNVDAGVNIADLPINLETNIKGDSSEYKNLKRHSKYTIIDNDAEGVSKEDFQKFLVEENINKHALDFLESDIENYLYKGKASGTIKFTDVSLGHSIKTFNRYKSLIAGINNLPNFIKLSFDIEVNTSGKYELKWADKFKVDIEF